MYDNIYMHIIHPLLLLLGTLSGGEGGGGILGLKACRPLPSEKDTELCLIYNRCVCVCES